MFENRWIRRTKKKNFFFNLLIQLHFGSHHFEAFCNALVQHGININFFHLSLFFVSYSIYSTGVHWCTFSRSLLVYIPVWASFALSTIKFQHTIFCWHYTGCCYLRLQEQKEKREFNTNFVP